MSTSETRLTGILFTKPVANFYRGATFCVKIFQFRKVFTKTTDVNDLHKELLNKGLY